MTSPAVTNTEQETRMVTTPHADLVDRAKAASTSWQYDVARAEAAMAQVLAEGDVFQNQDGAPAVPTWWDRDAWERHGRLLRQIEQAGRDLARLAEKLWMVIK